MDLTQTKLVKSEWEALEIPIHKKEKEILKLIRDGYDNIDIRYNLTNSLLSFMKITTNMSQFHMYFYNEYFKKKFQKLQKIYNFTILKIDCKKKIKIKKADKIRIENSNNKMNEEVKSDLYSLDK